MTNEQISYDAVLAELRRQPRATQPRAIAFALTGKTDVRSIPIGTSKVARLLKDGVARGEVKRYRSGSRWLYGAVGAGEVWTMTTEATMTEATDERIARLPKWARDEIERLRRRCRELKGHLDEHSDTATDLSRVVTGEVYREHPGWDLGDDATIKFQLGDLRTQRHDEFEIDVREYPVRDGPRTCSRRVIRVMASNERLRIQPVSSNVVHIWSDRDTGGCVGPTSPHRRTGG